MPTLVLASRSPARLQTLRAAGARPHVVEPAVDEAAAVAGLDLSPAGVAGFLARAKAEDVAGRPGLPAGALVLGCDSVLELDGEALGKPADAQTARLRWRRMRGRSGLLHTGHWLIDRRAPGSGAAAGAVSSTRVHFAALDDAEIDAYIATGEPLQVAGGFTLDGLGGPFVAGIEGDPHGVVGVSLPLLRTLLTGFGVRWPELWSR